VQVRSGAARWAQVGSRTSVRACVAVLLCCTLGGCFGSDGPAVFVGRDQSSALLVQWTDDGNGTLAGSVQVASSSQVADGAPVKQTTMTFTGKLDSDHVSLLVTQEVGQPQTWTGTLDGDELRVNVPDVGGADRVILTRSSADTFDQDVAALEAAVTKTRNESARSAAQAQRLTVNAKAAEANREQFGTAVTVMAVAQETVQALMLDPRELRALKADLDAARADLVTVKSNVSQAAGLARGFVACEFASQAQGASDNVAESASFLEDDVRAVLQAADDLAAARDELARAYATLQQLSQREGRSSRSASPTLWTLVDTAEGKGLGWRSAATKANKQMKSLVSQADGLAENAQNASC
jgi:hypothetical protein